MSLGVQKRAAQVLDGQHAEQPPAKGSSLLASLRFGRDGILPAWREERAFRRHVMGAVAMLTVLVVIQPQPVWWAVALFCSALLLALELFNSAIEGIADLVHPGYHPRIKKIKDMAGAAVIVAGVGTAVMGVTMILDTLGYLA